MTQYHYLDDSGDPGLSGSTSSSRHFALAMVQLPDRLPLPELDRLRSEFHLPAFEFKYRKTTPAHKEAFFAAIQRVPFRVRAVVVDKSGLGQRFVAMTGQEFTVEFISRLTLRALELDIANDVLVLDGMPPAFRRALRVRLSEECRRLGRRNRPFKKIVSGDSRREDGLQMADMIVGAVRHHIVGTTSAYYQTFERKVADLWNVTGE